MAYTYNGATSGRDAPESFDGPGHDFISCGTAAADEQRTAPCGDACSAGGDAGVPAAVPGEAWAREHNDDRPAETWNEKLGCHIDLPEKPTGLNKAAATELVKAMLKPLKKPKP
jgi:hypothetical protein